MTDYCRLCAELKDSSEIATSIDDAEHSMQEKLRACCQWTSENMKNGLPHSVCSVCVDKLDKCWLFTQSVQLAQQRLFEIFENGTEAKHLHLDLPRMLLHSPNIDDDLPPAMAFDIQNTAAELANFKSDEFIESVSDANFDNDGSEGDNFGANDEQTKTVETATSFSKTVSMRTKKTNETESKQPKGKMLKKDGKSEQCQCTECGKRFSSSSHLRKHQLVHTERPFECWICNDRFRFKYQLSEHIKTHPAASEAIAESVQCEDCGRSFLKQSDLKRHYKAHSSNFPFGCEKCGQRFRLFSYLEQHRLKHNNERQYECWLCHKQYKQTVALKLHMRKHVLPKNGACICELCGRGFNHVRFLNDHLSTAHSDERPYKCHVCGLGYKTKRHLGKHFITHTEFKHKCTLCDKAYRKKDSLRVHMETHTGVVNKPHVCDVCNKRFRKNYELTEHRRIHTGEKPYSCEQCNINFRSMSNYYGHLKKKHGISVSGRNREEQLRATAMSSNVAEKAGEVYVCDVCQKSFGRTRDLVAHRSQHTSGSITNHPTRDKNVI